MIEGHLVVDFHGHVGRWDDLGFVDDQSAMLRAMDAVGIDISCVFNIFHPEGSTGNNETATFVARHPDRFIGFAYVSPLLPDLMVPELERAVDELGFRAIKLYPPYTPYPLNHPAWDPIYTFANERGLAVLAHTGSGEPSEPRHLGAAAPRFPRPILWRVTRAISSPTAARPSKWRGNAPMSSWKPAQPFASQALSRNSWIG